MRSRYVISAITALMVIGATGVCGFTAKDDPKRAEKIAKRFLEKRMVGPEGAILTSGKVRRVLGFPIYDDDELLVSGVLSESVGLVMSYAVIADDRKLFENQVQLLRNRLLGKYGLFHWKVSHDGKTVANVSASLDDLRIAHALILASRKWNDKGYLDFAKRISKNILRYEISNGYLVDFLNWREKGEPIRATTIRLSYIDTRAMKELAVYHTDWNDILKNTAKILKNGKMKTGLYYDRYNFETGQYEDAQQNVINQFYCALFEAEMDYGSKVFTDWLKEKFDQEGKIYAQYDGNSSEPLQFFESTSIYALAVRYAMKVKDKELTEKLMDKMLSFQNINRWSPMFGGFFDDEVYSFDNLEALITLGYYNHSSR